MDTQFHILGRGAIGCLWASRLAQSGVSPTIITRVAETPETKISYQHKDQPIQQSIRQTTANQLSLLDVLLVCVKTYQLKTALESITHALNEQSVVILLQNGMGNLEIAQTMIPDSRIIVASHTHGAYLDTAHKLIHAGWGSMTLGPADKTMSINGIPQICQVLNTALAPVIWHSDIQPVLWHKLFINAVINPLTVLHNCKNGELLTNDTLLVELEELADELCPLASRVCPSLKSETLKSTIKAVARKTADNYSSMHQDVFHGQPTEIEAITGFLLLKAQELQIHLPRHEEVYKKIKSL